MAYPQVETTNTSAETSSGTSHTVNFPASIAAGNTLLCFFGTDGDNVCTFPAGWTKIVDEDRFSISHLSVAWKKATGSESGTFTVTTSSSEQSAHVTYRISGATDPSTTPPQATVANGSSTTADPPNLEPTGGSKEYLWFVCETHGTGDDPGTVPSGYGNALNADGAGVNTGTGRKEATASSENPGTFGITDTISWIACTVAVHPTAAGTNAQINIGDAFKTIDAAKVNIADSWKAVAAMWVNDGDSWKSIF